VNGAGELKSNSLVYLGDFKDGEIFGKGTFTWTKDDLQLKFSGTSQDRTFLNGKFEAKQGSNVVASFEGVFNVPFPTANLQPPSEPLEESKENFEPVVPV